MPKCRTRELLIQEVHVGSLASVYGETKTLTILKEHYFWHGTHKDVQDLLKRCATCQVAKSHLLQQGLYTPLLVPTQAWVDDVSSSEGMKTKARDQKHTVCKLKTS